MSSKVNYWTIPCNIEEYDIKKAFKELSKIEWKQRLNSVSTNDIIYIYVGKPYSQIMYKCKVNKIDIKIVTIDDKKFWKNSDEYGKYKKYMEIELLEEYTNNELLNYKNLKKYGLSNIQSQASANSTLVKYIEDNKYISDKENKYYEEINKKRVKDKKQWLKVLNNENQEDNKVLDILLYLYDCNNYTSNGKAIADYFKTDVSAINSYIAAFGKRVIDLLKLDEQIYDDNSSRRWNIPFETDTNLNKNNVFTWKLRKELIEALVEKYELVPKEETVEEKITQFIKEYPYEEFCKNVENDTNAREYFVEKFNKDRILDMDLDDFVIGKAKISEKGKDSFCYLIEITMQNIGEMRGSFVNKFGVWYDEKSKKYKYTQKYGSNLNEAFSNLKKEIFNLVSSGYNKNYNEIEKCKIANLFKGKILSTYYPQKYLCIFDEDDVNKFLNVLDIQYNSNEIDTLEKKKDLLKEYKESNKYLKKYSDYYFVLFLYKAFKDVIKNKNTITGKINNNIEFVNFEYLKRHEIVRKSSYRSIDTDYERINRNKKDVGNRGENAILESEKNKLIKLGFLNLAEQVCKCDNDAKGYDIISYDENGKEIHIEVKTNSANKSYMDFYITDNELKHLIEDDNYYIYYLFNIKGKPKCHIVNKKMILKRKEDFFQPVIYKVNVDVLEKK